MTSNQSWLYDSQRRHKEKTPGRGRREDSVLMIQIHTCDEVPPGDKDTS